MYVNQLSEKTFALSNNGSCSSSINGVYSLVCSNSWRGTNCTECGVINCAQLLSVDSSTQLREGCENCDHGYSLDSNRQCSEFQIFT